MALINSSDIMEKYERKPNSIQIGKKLDRKGIVILVISCIIALAFFISSIVVFVDTYSTGDDGSNDKGGYNDNNDGYNNNDGGSNNITYSTVFEDANNSRYASYSGETVYLQFFSYSSGTKYIDTENYYVYSIETSNGSSVNFYSSTSYSYDYRFEAESYTNYYIVLKSISSGSGSYKIKSSY